MPQSNDLAVGLGIFTVSGKYFVVGSPGPQLPSAAELQPLTDVG